MLINMLTVLYFIFFFITNCMFFNICYKIMDGIRFNKKLLYIVAFINSVVFTIIVYGYNQLPIITYAMVLFGCIFELFILFKNNILGILMCSFMATIYLVCSESVIISTGALILGVNINDITHSHELLFIHIVISWFQLALISSGINLFVPGRFVRIINQHKEQILFVLGFLFFATVYLTFNSYIYGYAVNFTSNYLPVHQIVAPLMWAGVVTLAVVLLIRFDYLHGYKLKSELLEQTLEKQSAELVKSKNKAEKDLLVDAYNKKATEKRIKEALKDESSGAFFIIDIDNFKNINDTKGHPFGDKVLIYLSQRISNTFREHDIIGRIGGDEFIVFMKNSTSIEIVEAKAKSLCRDINLPFSDKESGQSVSITISIGVALTQNDARQFSELYNNADIALYNSKSKGKNTYSIFGQY